MPALLTDLFNVASWRDDVAWRPFRDGIEIFVLYENGDDGPSAALLRYQPGANVPRHWHRDFEHILVLEGSQEDQHGSYPAGSFVVNTPGSDHAVASPNGCIVLAIWNAPVSFEGLESI